MKRVFEWYSVYGRECRCTAIKALKNAVHADRKGNIKCLPTYASKTELVNTFVNRKKALLSFESNLNGFRIATGQFYGIVFVF